MKYLTIVLLFSFLSAHSQEWLNVNSPFLDPTPTPSWKVGNYIELVYELDLKSSPDPSNPNDWITINDIIVNTLVTEISIGSKSYKIDHPGVSVSGGKFKFKMYGPDFDPSQIIRNTNWKFINYQLKYSLKGTKKETISVAHNNAAYVGTEGTIIVNRVSYNTTDKIFEIELNSSHAQLAYNSSQVLTSNGGNVIASFREQSQPTQGPENTFNYKIKLNANDGYDIIKINSENGHKAFIKINGASSTNPMFAQFQGVENINYVQRLQITQVENYSVQGLNNANVKLTTSSPSNSIKLIFDDSPYQPNAPLEIIGEPQGTLPTNIFRFNIPSDNENFNYGQFTFHFEGKSILNDPLENNSYEFIKNVIPLSLTTIIQTGNECKIAVRFGQQSNGSPKLIFAKTQDVRVMKKNEGETDYSLTLNLTDQFVKDNLKEVGDEKYLNVYVSAFGTNYSESGIKVNILDTKAAVENLEKIEGTKKKKKEKIEKYLTDNNFVGNTEEMTKTIFDELAKDKPKRNWSETWKSVGKFLKPAAGLIMLLI